MPCLHNCLSGEANSEANDERTNHIFVLSFVVSFASPSVALALGKPFFKHESKRMNGDSMNV